MKRWTGLGMAVFLVSAGAACGDDGGDESGDRPETGVTVFDQDDERGYSLASTYGGLVWTAGHLPESYTQGDSITEQTREVMDALAVTLEKAGAGFDTVVMTNVYLADWDDWSDFNDVYTEYFDGHVPPRVTVEVSSLAWGDIEISMVAHVRA